MKRAISREKAEEFDEDCKRVEEEIKIAGQSIQVTPFDPRLRKILTEKKKEFRNITLHKKRCHEKLRFYNMLQFVHLKESEKFWISLRKLTNGKQVDYVNFISLESWITHFQTVWRAQKDPNYPPDEI